MNLYNSETYKKDIETAISSVVGIEKLDGYAFGYCPLLAAINYNGTTSQWNSIGKGYQWIDRDQEYVVHCLDN